MTWAGTNESLGIRENGLFAESAFLDAPVSVVDPGGLPAMGACAIAQGYLWIELGAPGPEYRGRLGLYIEEAIEAELDARGASAPGISASTGLDGSLSDQLYRARMVEMRGLALGIPSLEGITNLGRTLDADDSGVLRWWMAATAERPVRLILTSENMRLRVYPSPVLFETLFEVAPEPVSPKAPSVSMAESSGTMDLSDLPPSVESLAAEESRDIENFAEEESSDAGLSPFGSGFEESPLGAFADLPDLDRALGLSPPPSAHVVETKTLSARDQLPLFEASRAAEQAALAALVAQKEAARRAEEVEDEIFDNAETSVDALGSVAAAPSFGAGTNPLGSVDEVPEIVAARATTNSELDSEEFLRVLEEESSEAPQVEAPKANVLRTLTPLPTKSIGRSPFLQAAPEEFEEVSVPAPVVTEALAADDEPSAPFEAAFEAPVAASSDARDLIAPKIAEPVVKDLRSAFPTRPLNAPKAVRAPVAESDESDPFVTLARKEWMTWAKNLDAARGPKPLSMVERMFVTDYTRLREAVRRGIADQSVTEVLDAWQESFASSYSEAFDALRVRGKRPTMVLDLPEMAQRLVRLHGARRVQLLMVDGLRFDLGLMVHDHLKARVDAALTERLLLWSALPTTTTYQLELLGKGPDGLKENGTSDESPALVARGRAAMSPRRIRTGHIELMKLDVVEDSLREPGISIQERLPEIAERTATAIADHFEKQAPRTLVVVFGDHGFALDPKAAGTTAEVRQGGSSPEEVLVPAFAWLTGAVH